MAPRCDDGPLQPDSVFHKWLDLLNDASRAFGKAFNLVDTMATNIKDAGFIDVVESKFKLPLDEWSSDPKSKERAKWYRQFWETGMEGLAMAVSTRYLGVRIMRGSTKRTCFYPAYIRPAT